MRRSLGFAVALLVGVAVLTAAPAGAAEPALRDLAAARGVYLGTATLASEFRGDPPYAAVLAREFGSVTPGNELKWDATEPRRGKFSFAEADAVVAQARSAGQLVHGHTLVWHNQLPGWLTSGGFGRSELRSLLRRHISVVAGRYAGQVRAWDVVNEPFDEDGTFRSGLWLDTLGPAYIADALRAARAADPGARLYINDYNVEGIGPKSDALLRLVQSLRASGVPIDGVGMQAHLILGQVPASMQQNIRRFVDAGFEVAITELDVRMELPSTPEKLARQAADYGAVADACLAVRGCVGLTVWDFTDRYSWIPSVFPGQGAATPYDEALRPKPARAALAASLSLSPSARRLRGVR